MSTTTIREYYAQKGSHITDADAQIVGEELERIGAREGLEAETIVDAARPVDAPLHRFFTWDDIAAAEMYRVSEAQMLARSVLVMIERPDGETELTRAFQAITTGENNANPRTKHYVSIDVVRDDPDMSAEVIRKALQQLLSWRSRYEQYRYLFPEFNTALTPVFEAIESAKAA